MSLDHAIDAVIFKIGNTGDRCGDLDAFVARGDPPTVRAPATAAAEPAPVGSIVILIAARRASEVIVVIDVPPRSPPSSQQ